MTPPAAWRWMDECSVPLQVYQHLTSETPSEPAGVALSIHSHKASESSTFCKQNDSPDPTGEDVWPLERDISCSPDISCDRKDDATGCDEAAQVTDAHSNAAPSHRIGTCYLDPDTGETVMPGDFFGEKELRWMPDKTTAPETTSSADSFVVESCPECGAVTDIDYGTVKDKPPDCQAYGEREPARVAHETPTNLPVGARSEHPDGVDIIEEPAVETHEDLQGKGADRMADTFSVPFPVQSWLFEALIETEIDHLHEIIDDHHDEIVDMARKRHREGHVIHGSAAYQWDAETRLTNVLEELADSVVYLTTGAIE